MLSHAERKKIGSQGELKLPDGRPGCRWWLETGLRGGQRLSLRGSVVIVAMGADLLELLGREYGGELLTSLLMNGVHLLVHDHRRHRCVVLQCGDLLVAACEDRLDLRGLIGGEVQPLAESCGLALGIVLMAVVVLDCGSWRGRGGLLCEGEAARENQCEGGREKKAVHFVLLLVAAWFAHAIRKNTRQGKCCGGPAA